MNKTCEWKDGYFSACVADNFFLPIFMPERFTNKHRKVLNYCPFCGADIRKPEPKVIIKKSSGTWVARYNGIDYLYTLSNTFSVKDIYEDFELWKDHWKPFSEIEITDEIAKLRPMVIIGNTSSERSILSMVRGNRVFNVLGGVSYSNDIKLCRIATVSDLEE